MLRSRKLRTSKKGREIAELYEFFAATHLHHVGNDSYHGEPFFLENWQYDNIWEPILATGKMQGGTFVRRYSRALLGLPRSFGKTEITCALMMTVANMEPVYNGQYAVIASSKDQAAKILRTLKAMIALDPDLRALWEPFKNEIHNRETGATVQVFPYSEAAVQSWHFNFVIADELHVWRDRDMYDALVSGMRDVPNALMVCITTAGLHRSGFLWEWLQRVTEDPDCYVWWHGADDEDAVDDRKVWERIALPSWVTVDSIEQQYHALSKPAFDRYVLNRFPVRESAEHTFTHAQVDACMKAPQEFDFAAPFVLGVDGATSGDSFAIIAHQLTPEGRDAFHEWVFDEPGESGYYDLDQIEQLIAGLAQQYRCSVGIDPARLLLMAQHLQDRYGVDIFEVPQSNKIMCPASDMLARSVRSQDALLDGCPKLAEHLANCRTMYREPYGWRFTSLKHGQGTERIDAAIAAAIAKYATATMGPPVQSFAETDGLWIL